MKDIPAGAPFDRADEDALAIRGSQMDSTAVARRLSAGADAAAGIYQHPAYAKPCSIGILISTLRFHIFCCLVLPNFQPSPIFYALFNFVVL